MTDSRLTGVDEDVVFDDVTADDLVAAFNGTAEAIEGQATSRATYVSDAQVDFSGYFSGLFADNASTASADATEVCNRLREVAKGATRLKEEAAKEQKRRETARKWMKEREERNLAERAADGVKSFFVGDEDPPVGPAAQEVSVVVADAVPGTRTTYEPGTVVGQTGGTSSAKPENLRSFATGSQSLNDELAGKPATLRTHLSDFAIKCVFGSLSADGVVDGLASWMSQNDDDVSWAQTLADAFAAAGGEGNVSTLSDSALATALETAGVGAVREDLTITAVEAVGGPVTSGYAVDPVNTATGNFVEHEVDLAFTGGSASLRLERTYSSTVGAVGAFGRG